MSVARTVEPADSTFLGSERRFARLRAVGRRIPPLREAWRLGLALADLVRDPYARPAAFDRVFLQNTDPWSYTSAPQQERHAQALCLLDELDLAQGIGAEVGCAEGLFTRALAARCGNVVALDWSEVALERARRHCSGLDNVEFTVFNLRHDPLPGPYHLLVVMDVLETIFRPWVLHRVVDKLIRALRPGGYLLAGNSRQAVHFETRWWARPLLRGGKRIHDHLAADPRLGSLRRGAGPFYELRLLRRRTPWR